MRDVIHAEAPADSFAEEGKHGPLLWRDGHSCLAPATLEQGPKSNLVASSLCSWTLTEASPIIPQWFNCTGGSFPAIQVRYGMSVDGWQKSLELNIMAHRWQNKAVRFNGVCVYEYRTNP